MKADRFERLKGILLKAADLSEAERRAFLDDACKDDPQLRKEVESILAHEADASGILKTGGAGGGGAIDPKPPGDEAETIDPAASAGQTLGPYILRELIGSGGMGEVWRAEQTNPLRRTVALKLIKPGMDSTQVIVRFEAERQALALMDHPVIAKVFDAGTTPQGRPYFAMEYVPGVPITEYCDARKLGTRERLELFQRVCEGVQHAHQKAVIHRDLKPSNILVTDVDGKPQPRIIDFGVAKATTQKLTEKTMYTAMGQLIGTPEYMSPEQADLTIENIDTRTDVYSLGVILYELLAGALPFEATELRKAGIEGIIRLLREKDPPRPSTKVSSLGQRTTEVAQNRRTEPRRLASQLRGDLDWIVMRSLEKDRNRRYASPQELSQDISRHLQHEPVLAGPPSPVYRTKKFIRRHRVGVGVAATIGLAVVLAFVLVSAQNARIAAARDEAEAVTSTLEQMLASVDPTKSGRDVTVKEMLDETAKTLGEKFKDRPLIEARLRHTVGNTYREIGEYDAAVTHFLRAVEIRSDLLGGENPRTLESMNGLVATYIRNESFAEAEALARKALEMSRRALGEEHPQTLSIMENLGISCGMQGRSAEAGALYREILEISRRVLGEEHQQTITTMHNLGLWYLNSGHPEEAEALLQKTLEIFRRDLGEEHPRTLFTMNNLANCYGKQGRYSEAEALYRRTLEIRRRVIGEEHPQTLDTMTSLAVTYRDQGRYDEAEALFQETLEIRRRVLGMEHVSTLYSKLNIAMCYSKQGRHGEAQALLRETLDISRRARGQTDPVTNDLRYGLACDLALQGRRSDAISSLQDALDHGYRGPRYRLSILDDPDLNSLHGDPEFEETVEELRRRNEDTEQATVE